MKSLNHIRDANSKRNDIFGIFSSLFALEKVCFTSAAYKGLTAGVLLFIGLCLFFATPLFDGKVLSAADMIFSSPFFAAAVPAWFARESNPLLGDTVYQFTPWRHFAWESFRHGILPLWNPYSLSGTPFIATMQSAVFYPINLLLLALPFEQTFVWSATLKLLVAGVFSYALIRQYRMSFVAALIGAISFMLCGFLIVWLSHPHSNAAVWLPALILCAEKLIQARMRRLKLRWVALLAFCIGVQFTGGHIETSADLLLAFGVYYILRWFQTYSLHRNTIMADFVHLITWPAIATLLGTTLVAVQLLPFLEWLPLSAEFQARSTSSFNLLNSNAWRELPTLALFVFPNLFNNPTWAEPYWSFWPGSNYNERIMYVGVLTLLLAIIGSWYGWRRHSLVRVWSVIALLSLGMALHFPIIDWLNQLPLVKFAIAERLRLITAFSLCILAAFGTDMVWSADDQVRPAAQKAWKRLCFFVFALGVLIAVVSNIALPLLADRVRSYGRSQVDAEFAARQIHSHPIEYYYGQVDRMVDGLLVAFQVNNIAMYAPALITVAGLILFVVYRLASVRNPHALSMFRYALVVLVYIDLSILGRGYQPSVPFANFFPTTPVMNYLQSDQTLHRVTALRQDLIPDAHMMFNQSDVRGLDFPTAWYNRYLNLVPERIPWLNYGVIVSSATSPLLHILNIKYVVADASVLVPEAQTVDILESKSNIRLWQFNQVQPRSYMVYNAVVAESDEQALQWLREAPSSVFSSVILSGESSVKPIDLALHAESVPHNEVSCLTYQPNQTTWKVRTDTDGYLFTSDAYYPGWQAYLDDHPTSLYRANLAFRSVFVPRGEHIIQYRYEPASVWLGAGIALVSLSVMTAMLLSTMTIRLKVFQYNTKHRRQRYDN